MEKVYYLKGMSTNKDELEYLCEKFKIYDIELIPLVFDYTQYYDSNKEHVLLDLKKKLSGCSEDEKVNVICHSMGCNFVSSLTAHSILDFNIILISPEFEKITEAEKKAIILSDKEMEHPAMPMKLSIDMLKSIWVLLKSKKWFNEDKDILKYYDVSILYSKGDKFVSRSAINKMAQEFDATVHEIDCNNHNPLLETNDAIDIIKNEIHKNSIKPKF